MRYIDGETGLPEEAAERLKRKFRDYEEEIERLKMENKSLRDENDGLKNRIALLESIVDTLKMTMEQTPQASTDTAMTS